VHRGRRGGHRGGRGARGGPRYARRRAPSGVAQETHRGLGPRAHAVEGVGRSEEERLKETFAGEREN